MTHLNKSYFIGMDEEHGWGNTTYFTFFSEFNRPWKGLPYIEAVVLIVLFLFSMVGNSLVFYNLLKMKSTRTVTNYLICNLVLADILFSCGSPLIAGARLSGTWVLGSIVCKMLVYVMFICASVMIWTMTIISIDRYICINKASSKRITPSVAVTVIVVLWLLDFIAFIPLFKYFSVKTFPFGYDHVNICTLMWPNNKTVRVSLIFTVSLCIIGFVIPLLILILNYYWILRKFWLSRQTVLNVNTTKSTRQKLSRRQRDLHVVKTLVMLIVLFLVMWLPIFICFVLIQADGMSEKMKLSSQTLIGCLSVALCNACVNPFLYGVMNEKLKKRILSCLSCKNKVDISPARDSKTDNSVLPVKAISYTGNSSNS